MRKRIDLEVRGMRTPRERVWAAIRSLKTGFTRMEVGDACDPPVSQRVVDSYVAELQAAGFLATAKAGRKTGNGCAREASTLDLVKDQLDAPRVTVGGRISTKGMAALAMWRAMKVLKTFDHSDIARAASQESLVVKAETAKRYVGALARAGYFTTVAPSVGRTATRYKLARNTGPHAPVLSERKCVFDRNTGQFAELQTAQEVCDGLDS